MLTGVHPISRVRPPPRTGHPRPLSYGDSGHTTLLLLCAIGSSMQESFLVFKSIDISSLLSFRPPHPSLDASSVSCAPPAPSDLVVTSGRFIAIYIVDTNFHPCTVPVCCCCCLFLCLFLPPSPLLPPFFCWLACPASREIGDQLKHHLSHDKKPRRFSFLRFPVSGPALY